MHCPREPSSQVSSYLHIPSMPVVQWQFPSCPAISQGYVFYTMSARELLSHESNVLTAGFMLLSVARGIL